MKRRKGGRTKGAKDRGKRVMNARSLENLVPIPAVLDGLESVSVRLRLGAVEARALARLDPAERGRVVSLGLKVRESGG